MMATGDGCSRAASASAETSLPDSAATAGEAAAALSLVDLPRSVLTTIMECLVRCSNPGQLIKLALTCRALHAAVVGAEGLWEQISISHGWSRKAPASGSALAGGGGGGGALPTHGSVVHLDEQWFQYYSRRMACRRNVRRFARLYTAFLSRPSAMALMPGAEPAALTACERRLGVSLPWELWELYRHRNGQAPGAFVTFADDMRLLGLDELVLERHPGLADLRQRMAMMGRQQRQAELPRPGGVRDPQERREPDGGREPDGAGGGGGIDGGLSIGQAEWRAPIPAAEVAEVASYPSSAATASAVPGAVPVPGAAAVVSGEQGPLGAGRDSGGGGGGGGGDAGRGGSDSAVLGGGSGGERHEQLQGPEPAAAAPTAMATPPGTGSAVGSGSRRGVGGSSGAVAAATGPCCTDELVVVVASNPSSSRRLMVALDGQVYLARGLSIACFATSVEAMIQKLLH